MGQKVASGHRGACEIASCKFEWLQEGDKDKRGKKLILYCDCCSGQNRNKIMIGMLQHAVKTLEYITDITLTFLFTGHTYMPADSTHATIETFIRKRTITAPSEWPTVIRLARVEPEQYIVKPMSYDSFLEWKSLQSNMTPKTLKDTAGAAVRWKDIRRVRFNKQSKDIIIQYSLQDGMPTYTVPTQKNLRRSDRNEIISSIQGRRLCTVRDVPSVSRSTMI